MTMLFYDHLVDTTPIELHLEKIGADTHQKSHLQHMVDEIIHHGLLEYILQKLHPHYHHEFLTRLEQTPHDKTLLTYLETHVSPSIETELQEHAKKIVMVVLEDLTIEEE